MKITTADKFWVVTDPTPESVIEDVLYQTNLESFENIIIGHGMTGDRMVEKNLAIYTDHAEARMDAEARLAARV